MTFEFTPYILPLLVVAGGSAGIAGYTWKRRSTTGAAELALLAAAICGWLVCYALEITGTDLPTKVLWGKLAYPFITSISPLFLLFALQYTRRTKLIRPRTTLLLFLIPAITTVLVLLNERHGLVWSSTTLAGAGDHLMLDVSHGIWFWIYTAYSYLLLATGSFMIVFVGRNTQSVYRRQAVVVLAAVLAPWIANIIYVFERSPVPGLDLTAFAFAFTIAGLTWAIFGFQLVYLLPIARSLVVEDLPDSMVIVDTRNYIVDINPAAARLVGKPAAAIVGKPMRDLGAWAEVGAPYADVVDCAEEISFEDDSGRRWFDLRLSPIYDPRGELVGRVATLREITARKQAEAAVNQLSRAVEATPVSVIITDLNGYIQYVNPKFCQITGYSNEEALGRNPRFLKTDNTPAFVHRQLWETIKSGREWHGEFCNRKKNGELFWERASISPIQDSDGQVVSYVAVKEDITEQRNLREQLRQRNAYLSFMHQITLELLDRREVDDLLQGIVDGAAALLAAPFGVLALNEGDALAARACTENWVSLAGILLERGESALAWDAFDMGIQAVENDYVHSPKQNAIFASANLQAMANFPVMVGKRCMGVLALGRSEAGRPFSADEVETGMLFTRLAALALNNVALYDTAVKEIAEHKLTQALLQQSETRHRQIVEKASDLIFLIDADLRFTYINPTTLQLLGATSAEELMERPFVEIVAEDWQARVEELYRAQALRNETAGYFEFPARRADGEVIWLGQNVQLIEDRGEITGFQCIARDITASRTAQQMLELARDQALEANHYKSLLVSRVSHELRTPLGAIIGFIELLQAGIYGPLNDEQVRTANKIKSSADYLTETINELLDGAQLEARRLTLRLGRCSPRAILEHIEARMAVLAANKGLVLRTSVADEMPRRIIGDVQRLEQILTNLVGNGIKYTDQGEVCVHIYPSGEDRWALMVTDTGMGIPEEDQAHIFDPFYQVQRNGGEGRRGTGLGLSITRQLVDLMGGTISVESRMGIGSAFTVLLPMEKTASDTTGLL